MSIACSKCGAPLEPPAGAASVRCQYCGASTQVPQQAHPQQMPQVVVHHHHHPSTPQPTPMPQNLPYRAAPGMSSSTSGAGCGGLLSLAITGFVFVIVGVSVVVPLFASGVLSESWVPGLGWDGSEPLICEGIEHSSASDVTANLPAEVALEADGNCTLELEDVNLTADQILIAGGNAHVTISDSTLRTRQPIDLGGNSRLTLRNTTLISDGAAVRLESNGRVDLRGGRVEHTGPNAFLANGLGRVTNHSAQIVQR